MYKDTTSMKQDMPEQASTSDQALSVLTISLVTIAIILASLLLGKAYLQAIRDSAEMVPIRTEAEQTAADPQHVTGVF